MRRKMLSAALMMCIVAILSTLSISSAHATPPTTASGDWTYIVTHEEITREADGNTFIYGEDVGTWTGTFDGTSDETFIVVVHRSGFMYYKGLLDFTGTVDGKSGTLVIRTVGKYDPGTEEWSGQWVIISGTDDLANLRGQGTFRGISYAVEYSGKVHFDPKQS